MGRMCTVKKCHNYLEKNKKCHYFRYPNPKRYEALRKKWLEIVGRKNVGKSAVVCSKHFEESCIETTVDGRTRLKQNSVPTKELGPSNDCKTGDSKQMGKYISPSASTPPTYFPKELPKSALEPVCELKLVTKDAHTQTDPDAIFRLQNVIKALDFRIAYLKEKLETQGLSAQSIDDVLRRSTLKGAAL